MTLAGAVRPVAGGTSGGLVRIACTGSPWGGPMSPFAEPPVSWVTAACTPVRPGVLSDEQAVSNSADSNMPVIL